MGPRPRLWLAMMAAGALVLSACGTRLPERAFAQSSRTVGPNGTGPGAGTEATGSAVAGSDQAAGAGPGASGLAGPAGDTGAAGAIGGAAAAGGSGAIGGAVNAASAGNGPNTASDVGVTPTSILIGNVTGLGGPLGPAAFGPTLTGLQTYVNAVNARGGINGRKLILDTCDDGQDGAKNLACAQRLVGHDKIFAFLDNNSLSTSASAHYEFQQGVPDLGLPLNNGYYKYPNMFTIYGSSYPRDGSQVGVHGLDFHTTGVYRFYKQVVGVTKAAFFFYNQSASQSQGYSEEQQAQAEGIQIAYESGGHQGENLGAANFDADVLAMKSKNVDGVFDAVDIAGNQKICASMDRYGVKVKAKVSTIEVWSQDLGTPAWSAPCRDSVFISGVSVPYTDTQVPAVAQFRKDFAVYGRGNPLHQWALEGYATGTMFADAVTSMGGNVTRKGLIDWLDGLPLPATYTDHGFFTPLSYKPHPHPQPSSDCSSAAQWQDSAGTFVTRSGSNEFACYVTNEISSPYADDGS